MTSTHLAALELRLSHERDRLRNAKTESERTMRKVWVAGIEKEIAAEKQFTGEAEIQMSDDDLLAELMS